MTGFHRLAILAIAALLVAGCGASASTSAPSVSVTDAMPSAEPASPIASPSTTFPLLTPMPVPSVWAEPSAAQGCPSAPGDDNPMVALADGKDVIWKLLDITRVTPVAEPDRELTPPRGIGASRADFLLGGGETRLELTYFQVGWPDTPHTISRLRMTIEAEGREPMRLPVRFGTGEDGSTDAFVDVPDIAFRGVYDVKIEWHDACFAYEATASSPLIIDPAASVEGCPERRNAAFDELGATFEPPIVVGPVNARLLPWGFHGKVASLVVIDPLPPYTSFSRDTVTFPAAPAATLAVSSWSDQLELWLGDSAKVELYRRGELIRWMEGGWIHGDQPEAKVVFRSALTRGAGGFTFSLPVEPGRYAATAAFNYNSACSFGTAGFVVGVDVE